MGNRRYDSIIADSFRFTEAGQEIEGKILALGSKEIKGDGVPWIRLETPDGEAIEILMGAFALMKIWQHRAVQVGGYLCLRYDGESQNIESAGNKAKLYSVIYFPSGQWTMDDSGMVDGKALSLISQKDLRSADDFIVEDESNSSYNQFPQSNEPVDFENPAPEQPSGAASGKKSKK